MQVLLSPSKSMDHKTPPEWVVDSTPVFMKEAEVLAAALKKSKDMARALGVSKKIGELNKRRYDVWNSRTGRDHAQPAAWAYSGDVFNGLDIVSFSKEDVAFAQSRVAVISGLYGLVRVCDAIQPYRLEMKTKLKGVWGKDLYAFWGSKVAEQLSNVDEPILNCASKEYDGAVIPQLTEDVHVVTPVFLHDGPDGPKQKALFSKYARGLMAKWVVQNRIDDTNDVTDFSLEGYSYEPDLSTPTEPVFVAPADFSLIGRFTKS